MYIPLRDSSVCGHTFRGAFKRRYRLLTRIIQRIVEQLDAHGSFVASTFHPS
jgi:hypothetical protein